MLITIQEVAYKSGDFCLFHFVLPCPDLLPAWRPSHARPRPLAVRSVREDSSPYLENDNTPDAHSRRCFPGISGFRTNPMHAHRNPLYSGCSKMYRQSPFGSVGPGFSVREWSFSSPRLRSSSLTSASGLRFLFQEFLDELQPSHLLDERDPPCRIAVDSVPSGDEVGVCYCNLSTSLLIRQVQRVERDFEEVSLLGG
jgi:hypothetical protein